MSYGVIDVPIIEGKGIIKHNIRLDLCNRFPVEDIIDPDFVSKVIRYLDRNGLVLNYDSIDIVFSKNDNRLKRTKKVIGFIGRFKVRRNHIEKYNVFVIKKQDPDLIGGNKSGFNLKN